MLQWNEYVEELIQTETAFQGINFSFGDGRVIDEMPQIIKASILMLEKITENMNGNNIIVFPEKKQSGFLFMIMKVLRSIEKGEISSTYDLTKFKKGEKLKLGNAVIEFQGIQEQDNQTLITIMTMDRGTPLFRTIPQSIIPHLQHTDTNRRVSPDKKFVEERKKLEGITNSKVGANIKLSAISSLKTHMDSSIAYVAPISTSKARLDAFELCSKSIGDCILIGQVDYEGAVSNLGKGQLSGIPPIVLASDLYSILEAVEQGHPVKEIIVDASDINSFYSQMDAIDDIVRSGVSLTFVTDVNGAFDLDALIARGFNAWRWDEHSITDKLYDNTSISLDKKTKNYALRNVEYIKADDYEVSEILSLLVKHKSESKEQSSNMTRLYDRLFGITFDLMREVVPYTDDDYLHIKQSVEECRELLATESFYISESFFDDCEKVINLIANICDERIVPPKVNALLDFLKSNKSKKICIIVSNHADKGRIEKYWQQMCDSDWQRKYITVLHPLEFLQEDSSKYEYAIVVGWLNKNTMRNILYSCNVTQYCVLLYPCEKTWQKASSRIWKTAVKASTNKAIIDNSLSTKKKKVSSEAFDIEEITDDDSLDELYDIEVLLRENKFKQYTASGKTGALLIEALPINYSGGYLTFYKPNHSVVSATRIIVEDAEKIDIIPASNLQVGDFVVERESDKNLIRDMADIILTNNGKSEAREMAQAWKKTINDNCSQMTIEQICKELAALGCKKGKQTIKNWINDEECIAPRQREDLEYIAKMAKDPFLEENLDTVFLSAQDVRTAHQQAGRILSIKLRSKVAEAIEAFGDIDSFNYDHPVELLVEKIGTVRVLKVIDVGNAMEIDASIANRLIEE